MRVLWILMLLGMLMYSLILGQLEIGVNVKYTVLLILENTDYIISCSGPYANCLSKMRMSFPLKPPAAGWK